MALDTGPVNVYRGKRLIASRARVFYHDGRLFVVRTSASVTSYETPEPTPTGVESWTTGEFKFTTRGCRTCGWSLRSLDKAKLIAVAKEEA